MAKGRSSSLNQGKQDVVDEVFEEVLVAGLACDDEPVHDGLEAPATLVSNMA
jgi:hypothetical protein